MVEEVEPKTEVQKELPPRFIEEINKRLEKNGKGGRPHFLVTLKAQNKNPKDELLNMLEDSWIKGKTDSVIAKKYDTSPDTIYRVRREFEDFKTEISEYLRTVTRRRKFYIPELDQSEYETVQNYIMRARRDGLKRYKDNIKLARDVWTFLNYSAPENWTADEVISFLNTKPKASQSRYLDCVRQVAPQIASKSGANSIKTGRFREQIHRRKKDIFGQEVEMIIKALEKYDPEIATGWKVHISTGAREGKSDPNSGLSGIRFDMFKKGFTLVDVYETKVRGGIFWRDCPVDLFFKELPDEIARIWKKRGKPTSEKLFSGGYNQIAEMYKMIRKILHDEYAGKVEPSLLKEFETLRPHDADKIHVNMLWEAGVPLEVVGGQFIGASEGIGLVGRGWLDVNVIKKYYLSMTARSERFKQVREQIDQYAHRFNGRVN